MPTRKLQPYKNFNHTLCSVHKILLFVQPKNQREVFFTNLLVANYTLFVNRWALLRGY